MSPFKKTKTDITIAQRSSPALVVSRAIPRFQLLGSRGGIVYNHPFGLMAGMRIFAMALLFCFAARALVGSLLRTARQRVGTRAMRPSTSRRTNRPVT